MLYNRWKKTILYFVNGNGSQKTGAVKATWVIYSSMASATDVLLKNKNKAYNDDYYGKLGNN